MDLLVGLGNPGPRHAGNRHNIGFMAADAIARRHSFARWRVRFHGQLAEGRIGVHRVLLLKPQTYMNESGRAVGEAARFYKLDPARVLVMHDEIDLRAGKVRVKAGGGAAGHNGLRSIDAHMDSEYRRMRLGIGHPGHKDLVHGYVLRDFAKAEAPLLDRCIDAVAGEIATLLDGDEGAFMSRVAHLTFPPKPAESEPPAGEASADTAGATRRGPNPPAGPTRRDSC